MPYNSYLDDPAYQASLRGGGIPFGAPGPMANLIPGTSTLPPGFSWSRDNGRGGEGTGDWLINAPSRQQQFGDPRSVTTYNENGDPTTSYQYWNRTPQPLDTNELGTIGGLLSPMTGGLSNFLAPAGGALLGGSGPVTAGQGGNMPYYPGGTPGFTEGNSGGLFDNLLGNLGNLSPAILAGYLGNQQRQDVMGQVGRLNDLAGSLGGPGFMNSITNPYDLQTGLGRTALTQNLQQRGVGGSSFGNQQLGNFDYMRGLGRGDLATRAQAGIAGTQGQLYNDALRGIVGGNAAYNSLLGAGLGASGSLFNRGGSSTGNGLFDFLRNLGGSSGPTGVPGVPGANDPSIDPNTGFPANYPTPDPGTTFDPSIDWGNLYG